MSFFRHFFDQAHRTQKTDTSIPLQERFAGANAKIPPDVHSILDVGCGVGEFLSFLPETYRKVGLDISYEALTRVGALKTMANVESLPFTSCSFDLVTCFEVLEHLPQRTFPQALRELERISRKYIMVSVPDREVLAESLVCCPHCLCVFNPSWHVRSFDEAALRALFKGFRMVECQPCGPVAQYGMSRLAGIAVLLARRRPPQVALCPQCGYSRAADGNYSEERSEITSGSVFRWRPSGLARKIAQRVFFRTRRPYWLLALYARILG
jgi:SAM-dependent methyltransferase